MVPGASTSSPIVLRLANDLKEAADAAIAVIQAVEPLLWNQVPAPGVWAIGKDAEHVSEAAIYHQWIVRLTIGEKVSSRRPAIERRSLTTSLTPAEAIDRLAERTELGLRLITSLTDEQLELVTRPPRAQSQRLAATIERVMIGHYVLHRRVIEAKFAAGASV